MKETKLGEFEEVLLLLVGILGESAYAFRIADEFASQTGRLVTMRPRARLGTCSVTMIWL